MKNKQFLQYDKNHPIFQMAKGSENHFSKTIIEHQGNGSQIQIQIHSYQDSYN